MAAIQRTGTHGIYIGTTFGDSEPLSTSQMQTNAKYIYSYLLRNGWTINAVCGLLGNMQAESTINPGRWQNDSVGNYNLGYGLVQWTPVTKYTDWCLERGLDDPSEMDNNLSRILYEVENGIQWIDKPDYPISFSTFSKSTADIEYLARAFLLCYERPADQSESVQAYRGELARGWYNYLSENGEVIEPSDPDGDSSRRNRKNYNFILFCNKRRKTWTKQRFRI